MNRRQFIKRGIFGGVLLAGAGLAVWPTAQRFELLSPLVYLSSRAFQVLVAVAARIVPQAKDPRVIAHRIDQSLDAVPIEVRDDINKLLGLFDNALAGLVLDGHLQPFTALSGEAQDGVLCAWRDSRLTLRRGAYQALRKLSLAMHYADAEAQRMTGYGGPQRVPGLSYDDTLFGVKT